MYSCFDQFVSSALTYQQRKKMSDPNDLFGSDDEDDNISDVETCEEDKLDQQREVVSQQILTALLSHDVKPKVREASPSYWNKSEQGERYLGKKLLVLYDSLTLTKDTTTKSSYLRSKVQTKLKTAGFDSISMIAVDTKESISEDYDAIIYLHEPTSPSETEKWRQRVKEMEQHQGRLRVLMPGGLLLIVSSSPFEALTSVFHAQHWQKIKHPISTITIWKKRAVLCNETAAIYWTRDISARPLQDERALLDQLAVPLSVAERDQAVFSVAHRTQIVQILQKYGVVLVISLRKHDDLLDDAAAELVEDMQETLHHLQRRHDVDLLFPRPDQILDNFREMSLREHRRCDLRSTPRLTHLCPPPVRSSSLPTASATTQSASLAARWTWPSIEYFATQEKQQKQVDEYAKKSNSKAYEVSIPNAQSLNSSVVDEMRLHPAMLSAIHETLCPSSEMSAGNWGRWNFEGPGPEAPQTIAIGQPGVVFSFPGCTDQTIHADTPHLFEMPVNPPLAPHYLNYFLPMPRPSKQSIHTKQGEYEDDDVFDTQITAFGQPDVMLRGQRVGQTAFVVGSHALDVTKRVMADDDVDELLKRLVRPMYFPGDALVFDCRILHFGLANQLPTMPETISSLADDSAERKQAEQIWREEIIRDATRWRPMIYINCTKDWFQDPKNWNDRKTIFPSGSPV